VNGLGGWTDLEHAVIFGLEMAPARHKTSPLSCRSPMTKIALEPQRQQNKLEKIQQAGEKEQELITHGI
jgi:hypothetical protein